LIILLTILVNSDQKHPWITSDIDKGNLQGYLYLLGGLMLVVLLVFSYFSMKFENVDPTALASLDMSDNEEDASMKLLHKTGTMFVSRKKRLVNNEEREEY
jgi:hypothetical protein